MHQIWYSINNYQYGRSRFASQIFPSGLFFQLIAGSVCGQRSSKFSTLSGLIFLNLRRANFLTPPSPPIIRSEPILLQYTNTKHQHYLQLPTPLDFTRYFCIHTFTNKSAYIGLDKGFAWINYQWSSRFQFKTLIRKFINFNWSQHKYK